MNIAESLQQGARRHPGRAALVFEGRDIAYAETNAQADRIALGLRGLGVGIGDRVALLLPNVPAFVFAYFGALKLGAIVVSINAGAKAAEAQVMLADSGAKILITTADLLHGQLRRDHLPQLRHVVLVDGESSGEITLGDFPTGEIAAVDLAPEAPAAILYTSGTTGIPKGATLSHANVVFTMAAKQRYLRLGATDRVLLFLPLFHCFGQNAVLNAALHAGAAVVLHRGFAVEAILRSVAADQVTVFCGVPTTFVVLLDRAAPADLGDLANVRCFFSAAAILPLEIERRWRAKFGREIQQGYGLTETSPFATFNHERWHRPGSVGTAIEGVEIAVFDVTDGRQLGAGEKGEIAIRGPNVMLGYWNRPAETAAVLQDGWFRSGDVGRLDEEGYLTIEDRIKDMVIVGGFNLYPAEVENVLLGHPAVAEVAVHGVPDPVMGERPRAVVVLGPGRDASAEELRGFCKERLADYKVPAEWVFASELPKSRTGKVLKRVLRERVAPIPTPAPAPAPRDLERQLVTWLSAHLGIEPGSIAVDVPFAAYGLTSLQAVQLAGALEGWVARPVVATITWRHATIAALVQHLTGTTAAEPGAAPDEADTIAGLSDVEAEALLRRELERLEQPGRADGRP